jgi:hypothetical protein
MARVASVSTSLTLESQSFLSGLRQAVDQTASSSKKIEGHLNTIVNAGKALGGMAMANEIFQLGKRALDYASSLGEVAQQLGVTTKDLQVYRYAATQVGVSQEEMDKGLAKLTVSIGKAAAGESLAQTFRDLGISVKTANGEVRTAGEVIPDLADALAKVKDPATRARIEVEFLGKTGQKLDTLLAGGSAAINEMRDAALSLGMVLSDEQIQKADNTADKLSQLNTVLNARIAGTVADNAEAIVTLADSFVTLVGGIGKAIEAYSNWASITRSYAPISTQEDVDAARRDLLSRTSGRKAYLEDIRRRQTSGQISQADAVKEMRALADVGYAVNTVRPSSGRGTGEQASVNDHGAAAKKAKAAAEKAAREAEQRRKEALAREDRYQSELARSQDEFLGLRQSLTTDVRERAEYEHDQVALDLSQRDKARQMDVVEGQLTAAAAAELKLRDERNAELRDSVINRQLDADLTQESLDLLQSQVGNQRDLLTGQLDLAKTASERRDLELQLLALQKREEKARLQSVLTMEDGTDNLNTSKAQKDIARDRLNLLDRIYGNAEESTKRSTMGPGEAYLAEINKSSGEQAEAFQSSAVNGLKSLEDQLTDTVAATFKFKGAFGEMANSVISDLLRIAIQRNITGPLANLLFGGSSGGASGGLLKSIGGFFGIGKGLGINSAAAAAGASYNFSAIPGLAKGGTIGGFSGIDKNLLSINGSPVARVMRGEQLRIEPNNDNGRGVTNNYYTLPSDQFWGAVDGRAARVAGPMSAASGMNARSEAGADLVRARRRTIPGS